MRVYTIALAATLALNTSCATTKASPSAAPAPVRAAPNGTGGAAVKASSADQAAAAFAIVATELRELRAEGADEGFWSNASNRLSRFTKAHPRYALGWYNLGVAQEKTGKVADAESSYARALQIDPKLSAAGENLAALLSKQGKGREAVRELTRAVENDPGAAKARSALARSLLAAGSADEAVRLAREALGLDPKNMDSYCVLAQAAVDDRDNQLVRLLVSQGMKIDAGPASACLSHALGLVLLAEKKNAKAIEQFEIVVKNDGGRILDARFKIAAISMGFKDFNKAIVSYKSITEIDASNTSAYVNLGVAYKGGGNFADAERAYLKAIEVGRDDAVAGAHFNLGVLYLKNMDKLTDAKAQFLKYVEVGAPRRNDPVHRWLDEIDQRENMDKEMKRMEAEAERQAEVDRQAAEADAKQKAEEAAAAKAEADRQAEIERKANEASAGEPGDGS